MILHSKVRIEIMTRFQSPLGTENKSSYHHSSDTLVLSAFTECPKVYNHVCSTTFFYVTLKCGKIGFLANGLRHVGIKVSGTDLCANINH